MHRTLRVMAPVAAALLITAVAASDASAQRRHYPSYSEKHEGNGYKYRTYDYYSPRTRKYHQHICVYYPQRPRYVYYWNRETRKYWGRYDLEKCGYSALAEVDQAETIGEICESKFPAPAPMPPAERGGQEPMLPPPEVLS